MDKSNKGHSFYQLLSFFVVTLQCQVETETGSAGEQPARDTLDRLTKSQIEGLS